VPEIAINDLAGLARRIGEIDATSPAIAALVGASRSV